MTATQPRTVLKRRPWRTTEIEEGPVPVFVKRFHDARFPGPTVGRWRDMRRALREARILGELRAAGVPVPEVFGIERTPEGVELRLEFVPGARPISDVLDHPCPHLARRLGELVAVLHSAGFAHGDAHLGNVLVGASGHVWIVDAASVVKATTSRITRDLVRAAAESRERTSTRFRARFLLAYLRRIDPARRCEAAARVEAIEGAARIARRRHVAAELDRWSRESGVVARQADGGLALLARRSLSATEALALARAALSGSDAPDAQVVRGHRAKSVWNTHARLEEHHIPAARPLVRVESPRAMAVFTAPRVSRAARRDSAVDARALGELAGALFDRGLRLMSLDIAIDEHGAAFVTLAARVCDAAHLTEHLAPWRDDGGTGFGWTSSADFVAGFLGAQRGSRLQRDAVRALILSRSSTS